MYDFTHPHSLSSYSHLLRMVFLIQTFRCQVYMAFSSNNPNVSSFVQGRKLKWYSTEMSENFMEFSIAKMKYWVRWTGFNVNLTFIWKLMAFNWNYSELLILGAFICLSIHCLPKNWASQIPSAYFFSYLVKILTIFRKWRNFAILKYIHPIISNRVLFSILQILFLRIKFSNKIFAL